MTLKEKIMKLQTYKMFTGEDTVYVERDDVLKLLEQSFCEDCVDRTEVLKIYDEWFATCNIADKKASPKAKINALPSVTLIRPKGHWIMTSDYLTTAYGSIDYVKCSCCGEDSLEEGDYCPNCGADMREVENERKQ